MFRFLFFLFVSFSFGLPLDESQKHHIGQVIRDIKWLQPMPVPTMLTIGDVIGKGTFGFVYSVQEREDIVAKFMKKDCPTISREIGVTQKLDLLYGLAEFDKVQAILFLKRYPGKRLDECALKSVEEIESVFDKAGKALGDLHARNIVHRDVHGNNCTISLHLKPFKLYQCCTTKKRDK